MEASLNWSEASLVEASLYNSDDPCNVHVINQHNITWADRWSASINCLTRDFTGADENKWENVSLYEKPTWLLLY